MTPQEQIDAAQKLVDDFLEGALEKVDPGCLGTTMLINAMGLVKRRYGLNFLKVAVAKALDRFS